MLDLHIVSYKSRWFMGKTHLFFSLHSNATAKHVAVSDGAQGTAVSDAGHGM